MAAKKTSSQSDRARARAAVGGAAVRDRMRDLSVKALRDRGLSRRDVSKLVHDAFEGAMEGVDQSIPRGGSNVLREVFEGLREGVHAVASAGSGAVRDAKARGAAVAGKDAPAAAKRIRAANDEFLSAVKTFATKTSGHAREELDSLVARGQRTAPKVTGAARRVGKAADGRLLELSSETARAGVRAVRTAAGALAMGAGGLLEGLAEAVAPRGRPGSASKPARAASAGKKRAKKTGPKKKTKKKAARRKA